MPNDLRHFLALSRSARLLLTTSALWAASFPLFGLFMSAHLWLAHQSAWILAAYSIVTQGTATVGFYLAAPLFRRYEVRHVHAFGLAAQAVAVALIVLSPARNVTAILLLSAPYGLALGLYWSTRNLLTLELTDDANRDYYFGLDTCVSIVLSVVMPILYGTYLERRFLLPEWCTEDCAYGTLLFGCILFLSAAAIGIWNSGLRSERPAVRYLSKASPGWNAGRRAVFWKGISDCLTPLQVPLLVLTNLGGLERLGLVQSGASLVSAIILYVVGRTVRPAFRGKLLDLSAAIWFVGAAALACCYTQPVIVAYLVIAPLSTYLNWNAFNPVVYRAIEHARQGPGESFAYVCDREFMLNFGRIVAYLAFIGWTLHSVEQALRFTPILLVVPQLLAIREIRRISRGLSAHP